MTKFALVSGGQDSAVVKYPYTLRDFIKDNPDVSIRRDWETIPEERFNEYNIYIVDEVAKPAPSDPITKNVVEQSPVWGIGRLTQTWAEVNASAEEIAERTQNEQDQQDLDTAKADAVVQQLINATPAQIATYMQNNVTDLASARTVLTKITIALSVALREQLR